MYKFNARDRILIRVVLHCFGVLFDVIISQVYFDLLMTIMLDNAIERAGKNLTRMYMYHVHTCTCLTSQECTCTIYIPV